MSGPRPAGDFTLNRADVSCSAEQRGQLPLTVMSAKLPGATGRVGAELGVLAVPGD